MKRFVLSLICQITSRMIEWFISALQRDEFGRGLSRKMETRAHGVKTTFLIKTIGFGMTRSFDFTPLSFSTVQRKLDDASTQTHPKLSRVDSLSRLLCYRSLGVRAFLTMLKRICQHNKKVIKEKDQRKFRRRFANTTERKAKAMKSNALFGCWTRSPRRECAECNYSFDLFWLFCIFSCVLCARSDFGW